jgi:hypothetical protein
MEDPTRADTFKAWGREQVRLRISTGEIPSGWIKDAHWWLQREEDEERRYNENMEAMRFGLQMTEAKRATMAAWISAAAAITAAVLALLTLIATVMHW